VGKGLKIIYGRPQSLLKEFEKLQVSKHILGERNFITNDKQFQLLCAKNSGIMDKLLHYSEITSR
jgi:hypothetical protein